MDAQELIKTCYKQYNKSQRYEQKLLLEAFKIAREKSLKIEITDGKIMKFNSDIRLYGDGNQADIKPLLTLAKSQNPSLYRKYIKAQRKFERNLSKLETISSS